MFVKRNAFWLFLAVLLSACIQGSPTVYAPHEIDTTPETPIAPDAFDAGYIGLRFDPAHQCQGLPWAPRTVSDPVTPHSAIRARADAPLAYELDAHARHDALSPGDLIELRVQEGPIFSGTFVVGAGGTITIPHLPPIMAGGRSPREVSRTIERELVENGLIKAHAARASIVLRQYGEASVSIGGAVFSPGLVSTAERSLGNQDEVFDNALGANNWRRKLSGVLNAGGGIRPDADITRVLVRRGGRTVEYDMSGVFTGAFVQDPVIVDGDYVFVPSKQCLAPQLIRTSRVTPPGIRIFISNPTAPIFGNNPAAIGAFATRLPYGSRLVQALASGNCLGGTDIVNADRYALLVGSNPLSGQPEAMRVRVEDAVRNPHRPDFNPYLQPGDAIACYDSALVNLRDFGTVASSILSPIAVLKSLFGG